MTFMDANETYTDILESEAAELSKLFAKSSLFVTILLGISIIVGVFGNVTVVIVFYYKYQRSNYKYFVISLAVIDISTCCTNLPAEIYGLQHQYDFPDNITWLCKFKYFINGFAVFVSAFLLLLIAIDRYRKVCRPLAWQIRPRRALQLTVIICVAALVLAAPSSVLLGKHTTNVTYKAQNISVSLCKTSDEFKNKNYPQLYLICAFYAPSLSFMLITIVLYAIILKETLCGRLAITKTTLNEVKTTQPNAVNVQLDNDSADQNDSISESLTPNTDAITNDDNESVEETEVIETGIQHNRPSASRKDSEPKTANVEINNRYKSSRASRKNKFATAKERLRTKTLIMFAVTVIFFLTVLLYFCIVMSLIGHVNILEQYYINTLLLFFKHLYLINHVINPFVYGIMDSRFRIHIKEALRCNIIRYHLRN